MRRAGFNQRMDIGQQMKTVSILLTPWHGVVDSSQPTRNPFLLLGNATPPSRKRSPLEYDRIHALTPKPNTTTRLLSTFWNGATVHIDISSRVDSLQSLKRHWISREFSFYAALLQASEVATWNSSVAALVGISFFLRGKSKTSWPASCSCRSSCRRRLASSFFNHVVSSTASISQLANDDVSDSGAGVWVDPTLLRKRLISWDRPDFFDLGTPPMRSTAGCPFSSDCFRLHISLAAKMFQLEETCPRFSRESRFAQEHSTYLSFQDTKKPGPSVSISALTWQREEAISRPPWER